MDVSVSLTSGVSLGLHVEAGIAVKELREALAVLGCSDVEVHTEGKALGDDAEVPSKVTLRKVSKLRVPASSPGKAMVRSATLRARKAPLVTAPSTPTKVEKKREEPKLKTPVKKEERKERKRSSDSAPKKESVGVVKVHTTADLKEVRERLTTVAASDLRKMSALASPSPVISHLVEHVLLALGLSHKSWGAMANELSDIRFIKKVCDADPVFSDRTLRKLEKYTVPTMDELRRVAGPAAVILMNWLQAMIVSAKGKKSESPAEKEPKEKEEHTKKPAVVKEVKKAEPSAHVAPDTQQLSKAAEDLSSLKNSDFREFRAMGKEKPSSVTAPLAAMQAALGKKDVSIEAALKLMINPATFVKLLVDATQDPKKLLKLDKGEFLILQKHVNAMQDKEKALPALSAIANWARAAHHYNAAFHKEKKHEPKANGHEITPKKEDKEKTTVEGTKETEKERAKEEAAAKPAVEAEPEPAAEAEAETIEPVSEPEPEPQTAEPEPEPEPEAGAEEPKAAEPEPAEVQKEPEGAETAGEQHADPEPDKQWDESQSFEDEY